MKKLLALLLALIMVLSLAACGGNETAPDDDDDDRKTSIRATGGDNENTDPSEDSPSVDGEITLEALMNHSASPEEDFEYGSYGDGTVQVEGYLGDDDIVVIPETLGGMPVKRIGKWSLSHDCAIKALKLPDSVEIIEDGAFALNDDLQILVLGSGTRILGEDEGYVFQNCTALKEIVLNDGLEKIVQMAFAGCESLETINIPGTVKEMGDCPFFGCDNLKEITLNEGTEKIGNLGSWCKNLEAVTLPSTLTEIGTAAFTDCTGLTSIYIPENVKVIGESAFSGCTGLTEMFLPDSVETIGNEAFSGCANITTLRISDSLKTIGDEAFSNCAGLTEVFLPDGAESIGAEAFSDCDNLLSVRIPSSVTAIEQDAFKYRPEGLVITGISGSFAHQFATGNSITFQPEDGSDITIEPVLPEDIILSVDGVEVSVIGKGAAEIMEALEVEYELLPNADIEEHPNGVPNLARTYGKEEGGLPLIAVTERFTSSDCTDIYLHRVSVDFNAYKPEVIYLMGIGISTPEWEVFNMFGQPEKTYEETYSNSYYWYDVQIGDLVAETINIDAYDGIVSEISIEFYPPAV